MLKFIFVLSYFFNERNRLSQKRSIKITVEKSERQIISPCRETTTAKIKT